MDSFKKLMRDAVVDSSENGKKKYIERYRKLRNLKPSIESVPKQIIYIDSDGVIADPDSSEYASRVYSKLLPMKGAIEGVRMLMKYYDVYILTATPLNELVIRNGASDKIMWYKKYFGKDVAERVILSRFKHLMKGQWLIDDRPVLGAEKFGTKYSPETLEPGKWIHFGSKEFPNWDSILKFFIPEKYRKQTSSTLDTMDEFF